MLEFLVLMIAVAVQSVPPRAVGIAPAETAPAVAVAQAPDAAETPPPAGEPASPAFLTPEPAPDPASGAAPAFLAPEPAAPAFLTPQPAPAAEASPAFLAPASPGLVAEPQTPTGRFTTATEIRPILNATRNNWILVREFDGQDLVYVTHLWSWRCGLAELRIGINGAMPQPWPLPPCHLDQQAPNAILESDGLPYLAFPLGFVQTVEIGLTLDDLSTDGSRFNRQGMPIP